MFNIGLILFLVSISLVGLSGISFRFRFILDKQAWGGLATPSLVLGVLMLMVSILLIYLSYPSNS